MRLSLWMLGQFDDNDENKLCYTEIFEQYTQLIGTHVFTKSRARG
jgi:hypothetical protein